VKVVGLTLKLHTAILPADFLGYSGVPEEKNLLAWHIPYLFIHQSLWRPYILVDGPKAPNAAPTSHFQSSSRLPLSTYKAAGGLRALREYVDELLYVPTGTRVEGRDYGRGSE
jgi:hypothetical protein